MEKVRSWCLPKALRKNSHWDEQLTEDTSAVEATFAVEDDGYDLVHCPCAEGNGCIPVGSDLQDEGQWIRGCNPGGFRRADRVISREPIEPDTLIICQN